MFLFLKKNGPVISDKNCGKSRKSRYKKEGERIKGKGSERPHTLKHKEQREPERRGDKIISRGILKKK